MDSIKPQDQIAPQTSKTDTDEDMMRVKLNNDIVREKLIRKTQEEQDSAMYQSGVSGLRDTTSRLAEQYAKKQVKTTIKKTVYRRVLFAIIGSIIGFFVANAFWILPAIGIIMLVYIAMDMANSL